MLFGQDRDQLRKMYCQAWESQRQGRPLEPLQKQIVAVIQKHPEYHYLLDNPDQAVAKEYLPEFGETNPFLHMGLHLAVQDQIDTDRPAGIRDLYNRLLLKTGDPHEVEHQLMECLAEMIWRSQKHGKIPDEKQYLACLESIAADS